MPLLEKALDESRSVLIIADDLEGEAMQTLVVNKMRGSLKACAIKSPGFGESRVEMLKDLKSVLGGEIISNATGEKLENFDFTNLGTCRRVIVGRSGTIFIGGEGSKEEIKKRIKAIKEQLRDESAGSNTYMHLKQRLAKLSGGVAILRVGGSTEAELKERKDRVDDALNATLAAIEEGIVPGGGIALARASRYQDIGEKEEIDPGEQIIRNACTAPLKQIVTNAGGSPDVVLEKILTSHKNFGYDAFNEEYGDMFEMGIIDPLKVVRSALENASSAASMMLTVGCAMVEENRQELENLDI